MYLDAINLFGWAINQYLSYGKFRGLKSIDKFDVNFKEENSLIRYILDVDLEYPDKWHELYNEIFKLLMTCCQIIVKNCG